MINDKEKTIEEIGKEIAQHKTPSKKTVLIAVEGYGGSGKTTTALKLATLLGSTAIVSIDDFIIKDNITSDSWEKAFDRKRLEEQVLRPATDGRIVRYQRLLWKTNELSEFVALPVSHYLIVEGISSYHPSIAHYYDYRLWIHAHIETAKFRGQRRDQGNENEFHWGKWAKNDIAYQQQYHPERKADAIVDNEIIPISSSTQTVRSVRGVVTVPLEASSSGTVCYV